MLYKVKIQDVDGSSSRTYKSLAGAVKRFEEMVGPVEGHINEMHYDLADAGLVMPSIECLSLLKGVGIYGNVAYLMAADSDAVAGARASWAAKGVGKPPVKDNEVDCPRCGGVPDVDESGRPYTCFFCHDKGFVLASEAEEDARDRADFVQVFYKRPAPPPPVYDDGSNDIPF